MRFSFFTLALSLFTTVATAQEIHSVWQPKPVAIDGDASEWPETFRYYDGNTMLQFAIANDSANFYICLKANDMQTQRAMLRSGLAIWIDPKGKKKETSGLVFPMRKEMNLPMQEQGPGSPRRNRTNMKQQVLLTQNTMMIYGMAGIGREEVTLKNTYGIEAALSWDTFDIMVLEYKIPAKAVFQHSIAPADTLKLISLGLVIPAEQLQPGERRNPNGDDADQDPNAGGMGNGGLMRNSAVGGDINRDPTNMNNNGLSQSGGSMGMNGPPPNNMYVAQDQKVWLKLRLAAQ